MIPQSWNRYAYVLNDPLRATDPLGLDCIYDEGGGNVTIVGGDCYSETDNGYYVDGSVQDYYIDQNGDLQFTFNPYNTTPGFIGIGLDTLEAFWTTHMTSSSLPTQIGR